MNINISLSPESIDHAISQLTDIKDNLDYDVEQLVAILATEGAMTAQSAYGEWPVLTTPVCDGKQAEILVTGDMPLIAEFGAGDATAPVGFENVPEEVYAGSYSEEHAQQYSSQGFWHFAGKRYTEVPGRHGLLKAKEYIIENATDIATEVIQL